MSDDPKIKWMYEGTKADVHREDFLTGKQITKDFELYSDVVREDPEANRATAIDKSFIKSVTSRSDKNQKVSALDLNVVMHEDPLVAIKVGFFDFGYNRRILFRLKKKKENVKFMKILQFK